MFDTHCHLQDSCFKSILPEVIQNARDNNISSFLVPGIDYETSKLACELSIDWDKVYPAIGIHPTISDKIDIDDELYKLNLLFDDYEDKILAIGEIGLDYYHYSVPIKKQQEIFVSQLIIAIKNKVSVVIHSRLSSIDLLSILKTYWDSSFESHMVFHCCEPRKELLDFAISKSVFIGVDGDVTYDNEKKEFIKRIPLDFLLLETDSPYLTPEPARSVKKFPNNPSNLCFVRDCVAQIKNETLDTISKVTTSNANVFLGL